MLLFSKICQSDIFCSILLCFLSELPYSNSMTKCSANGGDHATQEKEAFGSGEGQNTPQTLQPQNGTLLYRVDQTLHCLSSRMPSSDNGTVWNARKLSLQAVPGILLQYLRK